MPEPFSRSKESLNQLDPPQVRAALRQKRRNPDDFVIFDDVLY